MNTKIESVYATLSKSDKAIADYFLSHGKDIISMNIHELAAEIGTSSASVSRFVRKVLGKSFAETKIELAKNIESLSVENTHEIFEWASDFDDMPNKIISHIDQVCKDVLTSMESRYLRKLSPYWQMRKTSSCLVSAAVASLLRICIRK